MNPLDPTEIDDQLIVPVFNDSSTVSYRDVVIYLNTHWWLEGTHPTLDEVLKSFPGLERDDLLAMQPNIAAALQKQGVPPVGFFSSENSKLTPKKVKPEDLLDPQFLIACNLFADSMDKRSRAAKLKELGMTSQQFKAHLRTKRNRDYYEKVMKAEWGEFNEVAKAALIRNADAGDLQSIKYGMELNNTYRPNQELLLNFGILVGKLMEILQGYLSKDQLLEVADRFEGVIVNARGTVQELESSTN